MLETYLTLEYMTMKLAQVSILVLFVNGLLALSQFENNGYKNVIVSIHPDIPDENGQDIIDNIKVCNNTLNHHSHNKTIFWTSLSRFFWLRVVQNYIMLQKGLLTFIL